MSPTYIVDPSTGEFVLSTDKLVKDASRKQATKRTIFFVLAMVLTTIYLLWRIFFTIPFEVGLAETIFGILLVFAECVTCFTTFELYYRRMKSDTVVLDFPEVDQALYPDVDVFIATHNEPYDILYKTANACSFMEYPDKSKVHVYFCDDGNRQWVADLAAELGIGYLGLSGNKDAKSGNLNNALSKTQSPLIATFDADMIPQRTFLMKTVPYFFLPTYIKDEETGVWRKRTEEELDETLKIGLIQTPQSFYNPDLFQFNLYSEGTIPNEQDFFSREVNVMRNSSNSCAYTGSNTLISRQAMEDIGGFSLNTITEDFEVSVRIQQEKYITYATTEIQAAGLTTTDFGSMIKQRKRWARGIIQSLQNTRAIFSLKLTAAGRMTYLASYLYWLSFFNRIIFILAPIMFALFDFQVVDCTFEEIIVFWLPSFFFYSSSFRFLSSNVRTNRWSQTIDTIFAPYLIFCVLLESFGIRETTFKVTNKERTDRSDMIYATPHIILIILSVLAIIRFTYGKYGWALVYGSVIIFWLFYNLISLTYAVFFMAGRKIHRQSERIRAQEKIEVKYGDITIESTTVDLSDQGLMFVRDEPFYIPEDEEVTFTISSDCYTAHMTGKVVYVKEFNGKWNYAATIEPIDADNKRQYMQLIYDRLHSLPMETDPWSTIVDDVRRNVKRRTAKTPAQRRKQARIDIQQSVLWDNGSIVYVHDFNFKYFAVTETVITSVPSDGVFTWTLDDGTVLRLVNTHIPIPKNDAVLYELANITQLTEKGVDFSYLLKDLGN